MKSDVCYFRADLPGGNYENTKYKLAETKRKIPLKKAKERKSLKDHLEMVVLRDKVKT